jgi:hypothetical protein
MGKEDLSARVPAMTIERKLATILSMDVQGIGVPFKDRTEVERIVLGLRKAGLK